jgi:hypothetical protein
MSTNSNRVQTRIPHYQKWAIESLVGYIGRNEGDVLARIIGDWFSEHAEWLDQNGLGMQDFRGTALGPKAPVADMKPKTEPKSELASPEAT